MPGTRARLFAAEVSGAVGEEARGVARGAPGGDRGKARRGRVEAVGREGCKKERECLDEERETRLRSELDLYKSKLANLRQRWNVP